jgi:hypothetical protein
MVNLDGAPAVLLRIVEMTNLLETSLEKLQNHCQATVVNALSHISLNSVNKISTVTKSML